MNEPEPLIPQYVLDDWKDALEDGDVRAAELAYALHLALPETEEGAAYPKTLEANEALGPEMRAILDEAHDKYAAFASPEFARVDLGNPNILAFERIAPDERVLVVNNMARVSQPVKFREYAGQEGWDILNRVEFTFPVRAQLDPYECLWLLVE